MPVLQSAAEYRACSRFQESAKLAELNLILAMIVVKHCLLTTQVLTTKLKRRVVLQNCMKKRQNELHI